MTKIHVIIILKYYNYHSGTCTFTLYIQYSVYVPIIVENTSMTMIFQILQRENRQLWAKCANIERKKRKYTKKAPME